MREHFAIIVDSREQAPFNFGPDVATVTGSLAAGDYSLVGLENHVAIERKSLPDLAACVSRERERFKRELQRLRAYRCRAVVVEGNIDAVMAHEYRARVHPNAVLGSIAAWQIRYSTGFIWAGEHAAAMTLRLLQAYFNYLLETLNALRPECTCSGSLRTANRATRQHEAYPPSRYFGAG